MTNKTTSLKGLKDQVLLIINESGNGDEKIDVDKILSRIEKSNPDVEIKAITEPEIKGAINDISDIKIPESLNEKQYEEIKINDTHLDSKSSSQISDKNISALEIYNDSKTHDLPQQEKGNESQEIRGLELEKEM